MNRATLRSVLLAGAAALSWVGTAQAQEGAVTAPTKPATAAPSTVDEVIVTARRVTENQQTVPIPLTAIDGQKLNRARLATIETLNNIAPNVKVFRTFANTNAFAVYIRGVGRNNGSFLIEAPVALYVDDVVYPVQLGAVVDVGGIERVEVLRGPQGTLYGRNATTGAVKYMTVRPSLVDASQSFAITAGSFQRAEAQTSANIVGAEGIFATKLDLGVRHHGGYITDLNTGDKIGGAMSFSGRLASLWQVAENLEVYTALDGTVARDPVTSNVPYVLDVASGKYVPRYGEYNTVFLGPYINDVDVIGGTIQAKYDVSDTLAFKSITAYRVSDLEYSNDGVAQFAATWNGRIQDLKDDTFTQEFQALGSAWDERLTYVAGLFYLSSLTKVTQEQPGVANPGNDYSRQRSKSVAAFVDGSVEVFPRVRVSGGLRWTKDDKTVRQKRSTVNTGQVFDVTGSESWTAWTPRVGIDYRFTDEFMAYAGWGRGYKAGQVNSAAPGNPDLAAVFVPPEETENTEVGIKSQWFDRRLRVNVNYFWMQYTNQAQAIKDALGANALVISDASVDGLEVDFLARILPQWVVTGTVGTLNSIYENVSPSHPVFNLTDKTLQHAPKLTYHLGTEYRFNDVAGGTLDIGGDYEWVDFTYGCLAHAGVCNMEAYDVAGVFATYTFPNDSYQLTVAGTNIGGTRYHRLGSDGGTHGDLPPDEWSVTLKARW